MADIFDEVADDLRADRAMALARRYGIWVALAIVVAVTGGGGWQAWRWKQAERNRQAATTFIAAMGDSEGAGAAAGANTPSRQAAADSFGRLASNGPAGYRTLSRLRLAALKADGNDLPGALALWDQVAYDTEADPALRDLASLLWVQRQVDGGDPAALDARLRPLLAGDNPWRALAQEASAWIALRTGQTDKAKEALRRLANDLAAPDGVRGRASGLLAQLGEPQPEPSARPAGTAGGIGG